MAYGVLLGIIARERFGLGQHVQTSQLGAVVMLQALALNGYLLNGDMPNNPSRETTQNALWNIYKCGDDKWLAIGCPQSDRYWSDFTKVMGIEHLENERRFESHFMRQLSSEELIGILDKIFLTKPREHWLKEFAARQISSAPVQDYPQLEHDPQVLENGYITQVPHPELGEITEVGVPVALSETPGYARRSAPEFGEHHRRGPPRQRLRLGRHRRLPRARAYFRPALRSAPSAAAERAWPWLKPLCKTSPPSPASARPSSPKGSTAASWT